MGIWEKYIPEDMTIEDLEKMIIKMERKKKVLVPAKTNSNHNYDYDTIMEIPANCGYVYVRGI